MRILDTRSGSPIGANTALAVTVADAHTIPTGVSAVAVNLTAIDEATGGYLTAYADGTSTPTTTTVSFSAGQAIGAMSIIPVNTSNGRIDVYNASGGTTDVIADVVGYFTPGTTGQKYHPLDATRLFDTRLNNDPLKTNEARPLPQSVISAVNPTLVINLTATQETGGGNLSALPGNLSYTTPSTTSLIYSTNSIANLDLAATTNNYLSVLNYSSATTHLIIDTNGYFASY